MARESEGLRGVSGDSRVGDVVAGGLDASGLVAAHVLEGDASAHVGEQLSEGTGHGTRVITERVHEGLLCFGVHLSVRGSHVGSDECQLISVVFEWIGRDHGPFRLGDHVDHLLAASIAAGVGQEHPHVGGGGCRVGDQVAGEGVTHRFQVADDDHAGLAEQGGRGDDVDLSCLVGGGVDVGALQVRVGLVCQGAQPVEGTVDEKALGSLDQHDGGQRNGGGCRRA